MHNNDRNYYIPDIALTALLFYGISAWVYRQKWDTAFIAVASLLGASAPLLVYCYQQRFQKKQIAEQKAKDLRDELREYFLTNCTPFITTVTKDIAYKYKIYVKRVDENDNPGSDDHIKSYYFEHCTNVRTLYNSIAPLTSYCFHIRHKAYWLRFALYGALLGHCLKLYTDSLHRYLAYPAQPPPDPKERITKVCDVLVYIDELLRQLEFALFINEFDDDKSLFHIIVEELNQTIREAEVFSAEELFNVYKCEADMEIFWKNNILKLN